MIEYLLILTLTVALVLAVSKGVGKPLQEYMQKNVLDMVGCMLRVGQFPTKSFGLCQEAIKVKMNVAGNFGKTGDGGSGSSSGANSSDKSEADENGDGSSGNSDDDSDGSDSPNKTRVRSSKSTGSLNDSGDDSGFGGGATKRIKISNDDSGDNGKIDLGAKTNFGDTTVIVRRIKRDDGRIGGSFFIEGDKKSAGDDEKPENFKASSSQATTISEFDRRPTGSRFSIPKAKPDNYGGPVKEEKVDFSFLGMIKWIIIIGVLFFIVVFAASQLNSIRKGWTD